VTSRGARAPGISTAPTIRCALETCSATRSASAMTVFTRAPNCAATRLSASGDRSITTTSAPIPTAT
jgi:hypothetical protein